MLASTVAAGPAFWLVFDLSALSRGRRPVFSAMSTSTLRDHGRGDEKTRGARIDLRSIVAGNGRR